ncbi:phosphoribosylglycinamide formyltransferase [Thiohalobacter sp. IOR34]|uniref:phosphoribosylglycinamide formyltransferase n=1 Tax=Thiohalobacter sp. IOR34 TaxID=3057176 RepID=UPI0025B019D2|nr:phosphoribosylglycinamide formyltransferase [Thiohalobacter sp. IOR34]WJW76061.1 phosphoribosylglycinamide formyltransferase [Thiohalobacter sp. IOR34]
MSDDKEKCPIVILISGRGSNLQSIIDEAASGRLPVEIRAVISNRADAAGLERARAAGIETRVLEHGGFADREAYDRALAELIDSYHPALVVLAGFMRILSPAFVRHYRGRLLNIHPSLLPRFRGLDTHRRALEAGETEHGASVHFVTEELDGGPVFLQVVVPVRPGDDPERLAARVLEQEHRLYPEAIRWFAEGRIRLDDGERLLLDGKPLHEAARLAAEQELGARS